MINITEKGGVGDGKTLNTKCIQNCIDICSGKGGGTVLIDNGIYICGTIYLKSNVTLKITSSAKLLASPDIADYTDDTHYNRYKNEKNMDRCFIYAQDAENICLKGDGEINGNPAAFPNEGSIYRPMMIRFLRCKNIRLQGLKLMDSPAWTTAFLDSSYIWVRDVVINNTMHYNGDGLDFDGCSHVFVDGCSISGTDDNLCLQSSSKEFPVENIHISNCTFSSVCAAIRIGLKSIGDIRNVAISNCTMQNVWKEGVKIECTEGGSITDILVNNIAMHSVSKPIFVILNNRFMPDAPGNSIGLDEVPEIGTLARITFTNITATDGPELTVPQYRFNKDVMGAPWFNGIRIDAEDNHKIEDIILSNIRYSCNGGVKSGDIPDSYPDVLDQKLHPGKLSSDNYYPNWSRTTFMDIRNVNRLYLSNIQFSCFNDDEREKYLIEKSSVQKEEIYLINI